MKLERIPESRRRIIFLRFLDQVMWSAATFLFNLVCSLSLSVEGFAFVAVATTVGFVIVAVGRATSIQARVIVASRSETSLDGVLAGGRMWKIVTVASCLAFGCVWIIAGFTGFRVVSILVLVAFLVSALVLADIPRQSLVMSSKHGAACVVSGSYFCGALLALVFWRFADLDPVPAWLGALLVASILGWIFIRGRGTQLSSRTVRPYAFRLGVESLYAALAGQTGMFVLVWEQNSGLVAGYRLTYVLVFAPIFFIVQGLAPLFLVEVSKRWRHEPATVARLTKWGQVGIGFLTAVCIAGTHAVLHFVPHPPSYDDIVPWLLPVGVGLLGAQALELTLIWARFMWPNRTVHIARTWSLLGDAAGQIVSYVVWGIPGLVISMLVFGLVKLVAGVILQVPLLRTAMELKSKLSHEY